jgi:hypothetical protein
MKNRQKLIFHSVDNQGVSPPPAEKFEPQKFGSAAIPALPLH